MMCFCLQIDVCISGRGVKGGHLLVAVYSIL